MIVTKRLLAYGAGNRAENTHRLTAACFFQKRTEAAIQRRLNNACNSKKTHRVLLFWMIPACFHFMLRVNTAAKRAWDRNARADTSVKRMP